MDVVTPPPTGTANRRRAAVISISDARAARSGSRPPPTARRADRSVASLVEGLPKTPDDLMQIRSMVGVPGDVTLNELGSRLRGETRDDVAIELGRIATPTALALLEAALSDHDPRVRLAAARGLRAAGVAAVQAVDALVARLADPCWAIVEEIANTLGDLGADAICAARPIEKMLWSESWRVEVETDIGSQAHAALGADLANLIHEAASRVRQALSNALEAIRGAGWVV